MYFKIFSFVILSSIAMQTAADPLKHDLLPDKRFCGFQHSDDYFRSSSATGISEFPWMARIRSQVLGSPSRYSCAGSLINKRYILTTATCVQPSNRALDIRLGEYNTRNDTDCIQDYEFFECSEPLMVVTVEKIIRHPNYNTLNNNIALIRLNEMIMFSDYVRPICLPSEDMPVKSPNDILFSSGWGLIINTTHTNLAEVKKKTAHKLISKDECSNKYTFVVPEDCFCTTQLVNNTNTDFQCNGDGGAPVMFSERGQWYQEGILSAIDGLAHCNENTIIFHTRVRSFLKWIIENLEP